MFRFQIFLFPQWIVPFPHRSHTSPWKKTYPFLFWANGIGGYRCFCCWGYRKSYSVLSTGCLSTQTPVWLSEFVTQDISCQLLLHWRRVSVSKVRAWGFLEVRPWLSTAVFLVQTHTAWSLPCLRV
jgi:hypothetical protein